MRHVNPRRCRSAVGRAGAGALTYDGFRVAHCRSSSTSWGAEVGREVCAAWSLPWQRRVDGGIGSGEVIAYGCRRSCSHGSRVRGATRRRRRWPCRRVRAGCRLRRSRRARRGTRGRLARGNFEGRTQVSLQPGADNSCLRPDQMQGDGSRRHSRSLRPLRRLYSGEGCRLDIRCLVM